MKIISYFHQFSSAMNTNQNQTKDEKVIVDKLIPTPKTETEQTSEALKGLSNYLRCM